MSGIALWQSHQADCIHCMNTTCTTYGQRVRDRLVTSHQVSAVYRHKQAWEWRNWCDTPGMALWQSHQADCIHCMHTTCTTYTQRVRDRLVTSHQVSAVYRYKRAWEWRKWCGMPGMALWQSHQADCIHCMNPTCTTYGQRVRDRLVTSHQVSAVYRHKQAWEWRNWCDTPGMALWQSHQADCIHCMHTTCTTYTQRVRDRLVTSHQVSAVYRYKLAWEWRKWCGMPGMALWQFHQADCIHCMHTHMPSVSERLVTSHQVSAVYRHKQAWEWRNWCDTPGIALW